MMDQHPRTSDLQSLKRLLAEAEADLARLSREESDRILQMPKREHRFKAYMQLREAWAKAGDRLRPDDEERIRASLVEEPRDASADLPDPPEAPSLPLTPVSVLGWAQKYRLGLLESALQRSASSRGAASLSEIEAALASGGNGAEARLPEVAVLRQLDVLIGELRDGLEARQLAPQEPLEGRSTHLPALIRTVSTARGRREIAIPPVPATPPLRLSMGELLQWLEDLLTFEESVGARALLHAGAAFEPVDARARFLAAARSGAGDVAGHAAAQISSWRLAERLHRCASAALHAGWLTRDRLVSLPSYDGDELEVWFQEFSAPPAPVPVMPLPATPQATAAWWIARRTAAVRQVALSLLADGAVRAGSDIDALAATAIERRAAAFRHEHSILRDCHRILVVCDEIAQSGRMVEALTDCSDADEVVSAWLPQPAAGANQAGRAMAPLVLTGEIVSSDAQRGGAGKAGHLAGEGSRQEASPTSAPRAVPIRQSRQAGESVVGIARLAGRKAVGFLSSLGVATLVLCGTLSVLAAYQLGVVLVAGFEHGMPSAVTEAILRSSRIWDPSWMALGVAAGVSVAIVVLDVRMAGWPWRRRGWSIMRLVRLVAAAGLFATVWFQPASNRFVSTGDGLPAWPERIVEQGGVPMSTLNPNEGVWFARRVVAPMRADDVASVPAGQAPLVLLREVGFFGRHIRWWLANEADVEKLVEQPVVSLPVAPAVVSRRDVLP